MTKRLEKVLNDYHETEIARLDDNDFRSIVEAGLWSLLTLSSEAVDPVVNKVGSDCSSEKEGIETTFKEAVDDLGKEYSSLKVRIETDCKAKLDDIKKSYEQGMLKVKRQFRDEKRDFRGSTQRILDNAKEEHNYAAMVFEVAEREMLKKCKIRKRETEKKISFWRKGLDDLEEAAKQVLSKYNTKIEDGLEIKKELSEDESNDSIAYERYKMTAESIYHEMMELFLPKIFLKTIYDIISFVICLLLGFSFWLVYKTSQWEFAQFISITAITLSLFIVLFISLRMFFRKRAKHQLKKKFEFIREQVHLARKALDVHLEVKANEYEQDIVNTRERHASQQEETNKKYNSIKAETEKKSQQSIKQANRQFNRASQDLKKTLEEGQKEIESLAKEKLLLLKKDHDDSLAKIEDDYKSKIDQMNIRYDSIWRELKNSWQRRLDLVKTLFDRLNELDKTFLNDWQDYDTWKQCKPDLKQQKLIRFGKIKVNLAQIARPVGELMPDDIKTVQEYDLPATLAFPNYCSLFLQTLSGARGDAIGLIKSVMARLFISQPAGRVHFNIFDPIGLGENFVGFMHAVDYEKSLVGGRIWTKREHIQKCLSDLTTHMENVIQKYLRNEFETIEEYNQQAGELAEPYRFLVIADFPTNFSDESIHHLKSIINSGPKCGVYTIIVCDQSQKLPDNISQEDLSQNGVHLISRGDAFQWQNETLRKIPLEVDMSPSEEILTEIVQKVGAESIDSTKVEVPFELIAPGDHEFWTKNSADEIDIRIGKAGAKRFQNMRLGKGVNQHILIAGKTGSGKSTLFHAMITNLALWYSPDEIEMYLVDFKQGVEFKTYASHKLPHVRAVAIESDREFGMSILQKLDLEMAQRGEQFRKFRVQDISDYRNTTNKKIPRIVLIIDEFHILFSEDDKIAHDSTMLLEKLVRQGRAFGIHIILGSQSLAGAAGISRSIMGQMAVRIALHCSEMDTQYVLNEDNTVASYLSRPGEAVYNDAGGMVVGNNPFQVAWLPKSVQDIYLSRIKENYENLGFRESSMIVFEGNVPADISNNVILAAHLSDPAKNEDPAKNPPVVFLGEPITIKQPTSVTFERQNGANLLIVGQQEVGMTGILCSALISLLASLSARISRFVIFDDNPSDSSISLKIRKICSHFGHNCKFLKVSEIESVVNDLSHQIKHRLENNIENVQSEFLLISNLQHCRKLYRKEEDWSFNSSQDTVNINKEFAEILQEGPLLGIHTIIGVDTFNTVERVFDRQSMREFNNRVLFQMSASDSNNLIDSPIANYLGFQRALLYNEEQGIIEKFRYYAPPEQIGNLNLTHLD